MKDIKSLKFVNKSSNPNPCFADKGCSGFDIRAWITSENGGTIEYFDDNEECCVILKPLERMMIHTGLYFDIPNNCEIQIRPRSGLAYKQGLTIINTPATIDESYTGESCILVINLSNEDIIIKNGDRIAQAVLMPVFNGRTVSLDETDKITKETERGTQGFGHTGVS